MKIKYTGSADFKGLTTDDLKRVGFEGDLSDDLMFTAHVPTEVPDEVAEFLLSTKGPMADEPFEKSDDAEFERAMLNNPQGAPSEDAKPSTETDDEDQLTLPDGFDPDEADDEQLGDADSHPQQGVGSGDGNFNTTPSNL